MLPDKDVGCHRTGFQMTCFDGVTQHKCQLWCHVSGTDAMNQPIDVFGCSDQLEIKLLHEVAKEVRQSAASTDKVANEVKETRDMASVRDVLLINTIKANEDVQWWEQQRRWLNQASGAGSERLTGHADAPRIGGPELSDPGDGGLLSQGAERDGGGGADGNPEAA